MDVRVTTTGPGFDALTRETVRALKSANRVAGRQIGRVGKKAMGDRAPRMFGRKLAVKAKVEPTPVRVSVEFVPAPRTAGGWAMQESGRRGGYTVRPRRGKALHGGFTGGFATVTHPGRWGGHRAWTKAGERLGKALDREIADVYDKAMG